MSTSKIERLWGDADLLAAGKEGWAVFNLGEEHASIEHFHVASEWTLSDGSHPPQLNTDDEAHELVRQGALRGSLLHIKALMVVSTEEQWLIMRRLIGFKPDLDEESV